MHSPSGSLLTLRVRYWTHWKSFDRHVPCADVVPRDLKVSRYRGCCVGRPTLLLRTESQQRFGFSKLSCLDSATTLAVPEPAAFGSPWAKLGFASCGSDVSCRTAPHCRFSHRVQWSREARSGRRVQSRVLVFKDGHPHLVGLPPPVPNRLLTMSRHFHRAALAQAGARSAETAEHRTCDTPSRCTKSSSACCSLISA